MTTTKAPDRHLTKNSGLRLPTALLTSLRALAKAEDRSLTNYLTRVLQAHLSCVSVEKPEQGKANAQV